MILFSLGIVLQIFQELIKRHQKLKPSPINSNIHFLKKKKKKKGERKKEKKSMEKKKKRKKKKKREKLYVCEWILEVLEYIERGNINSRR